MLAPPSAVTESRGRVEIRSRGRGVGKQSTIAHAAATLPIDSDPVDSLRHVHDVIGDDLATRIASTRQGNSQASIESVDRRDPYVLMTTVVVILSCNVCRRGSHNGSTMSNTQGARSRANSRYSTTTRASARA